MTSRPPRPDPEVTTPLLDIGEGIGAVVVYLDGSPARDEIEAAPEDRPADRFHTGVHPLVTSGGTVQVAVFSEVAEGGYVLLDDDGSPLTVVRVAGGRVTEVDLRRR